MGIHTRTIPALSLTPAATRWAFLLSAAGWLLALVARYGGQDWPALLPGVACGGAGAAVARRIAAGRTALPGMRVSGATVLSVAIAIAATLLTGILRGRTPWRLLCLRRAA
ncbi:hypothetical protein H7U16_20315 [Klebsiella pneumoniae]|uniref:Uncharacterized protein n=1 Tax=Klebsiella pneumoniae TaxID=573 RepID=A0A7X1LN33_KLEPN|nr:hypothetical protein [Klebsiella pneumoniae]